MNFALLYNFMLLIVRIQFKKQFDISFVLAIRFISNEVDITAPPYPPFCGIVIV